MYAIVLLNLNDDYTIEQLIGPFPDYATAKKYAKANYWPSFDKSLPNADIQADIRRIYEPSQRVT
jgi:hypothetical protein